jgi:hypothetical protein
MIVDLTEKDTKIGEIIMKSQCNPIENKIYIWLL